MRDANGIVCKCMVQAISLGHCTVLIQQEGKRRRMLPQIFSRVPDPVSFLGSDVRQTRAESLKLVFVWLDLSQPLPAVWSPRAAQEFKDQWSAGKQIV